MSIKDIHVLAKAITGYTPDLNGVSKLAKAFEGVDSDLQSVCQGACEGLKKLAGVGKGTKHIGASRFASKAPSSVYPSKGELVANLLLSLYTSTSSRAKELARELAVAVVRDVAKEVPIRGKYV